MALAEVCDLLRAMLCAVDETIIVLASLGVGATVVIVIVITVGVVISKRRRLVLIYKYYYYYRDIVIIVIMFSFFIITCLQFIFRNFCGAQIEILETHH